MRRSGVALLLLFACGGGKLEAEGPVRGPRSQASKVPVEKERAVFTVVATRVGSAVHLEVTGLGRGYLEGSTFEDTTTWRVRCWLDGQELDRVVNGSSRVERVPVGAIEHGKWDITVVYQVGFALLRRADEVEVEVDTEGARRYRDNVELDDAAEPD